MKILNHHFKFSRIILVLLFPLFAANIFAANLTEYRERVREARESLKTILDNGENKEAEAEKLQHESSQILYVSNERVTLNKVLENLHGDGKVEWQGGTVEIENLWLIEELKKFEQEKDGTKRRVLLNGVIERLAAIEFKLDELIGSKSASSRSKDEDKRKLAEILRRDEYKKPEPKQENILQRKWREFREWMRKNFPKSSPVSAPSEAGVKSVSVVTQFVILGLALAVIGYLFYRFAPFLRERFKRRQKAVAGERVILGEKLAADETPENLFAEAERLAREGDLRGAIRKGYIAMLCDLSDRKIIGLARHKTNRDYLRDVRGKTELHDDLRTLTGSFERHWYGLTATGAEDWQAFREKYHHAVGRSGQANG